MQSTQTIQFNSQYESSIYSLKYTEIVLLQTQNSNQTMINSMKTNKNVRAYR